MADGFSSPTVLLEKLNVATCAGERAESWAGTAAASFAEAY